MSNGFEYQFPAIRGVQAKREYFVSMCPLRLLPRLFLFNEEELVPELRAQRQLNRARLPELTRYIVQNESDYVFSAITASVDAEVRFEAWGNDGDANRIGLLRIPMSARFIINDGQHRRAAIEMALREKPELADETIAVVFFMDLGLERCQQMFADLNRYAIRPSSSLGILYDHRDETAQRAKSLISKSPVFRDVVELEKTSLSPRSRRLFTLSAIYRATGELLKDIQKDSSPTELADLALEFWEQVASHIVEWESVRKGLISAGEIRTDYIHSHGVVLQAIARAGNHLIRKYPKQWTRKLASLGELDWRRANAKLWEGRALIGGRLSKNEQNVALTANAIKSHLKLPLSPEEARLEDALKRGSNGQKGR